MRTCQAVVTRDREQLCWEMLHWFESPRYVEEVLRTRHGATLADAQDKAREIVSYVVQAREYFEAARQVTLATQPTLVYYGMACFASAITLATDRAMRQAGLGRGHGVTLDESQQWADLDSLRLVVKGPRRGTGVTGTLADLVRALQVDHYLLTYGTPSRRVAARAQRQVALREGQGLPLGELLVALPDVADLALQRYGSWPEAAPRLEDLHLQEMGRGGGFRIVIRPGTISALAARECLSRDCTWEEKGELGSAPLAELVSETVPTPDDLPLSRLFRGPATGWHVYDRADYLLMPAVAAFLAVGYCLGFLARYRPVRWAALTGGVSSHAVQVIRRFQYEAFREFPVLALRELSDVHWTFERTSALMRD